MVSICLDLFHCVTISTGWLQSIKHIEHNQNESIMKMKVDLTEKPHTWNDCWMIPITRASYRHVIATGFGRLNGIFLMGNLQKWMGTAMKRKAPFWEIYQLNGRRREIEWASDYLLIAHVGHHHHRIIT